MADYSQTALVRSLNYLSQAQAAIANNLANVDTAGFKRRDAVAVDGRTFATELRRKLPTVDVAETIDWQPGSTHETGNHLDVALGADTFLRVQDGKGRNFYTRTGKLQLDRNGFVVTQSGMRFLDQNGNPLKLDEAELPVSELKIAPSGEMTNMKTGQTYGQLGVIKLPDPRQLRGAGPGLYVDSGNQTPVPQQAGVQQGYEEGSNVDSLQELVQMIVVQRSFSATQRALGSVGRMHDNLIANLNR